MLRQQGAVADAGSHQNDIPLLEPVPFRADQIFGAAGIPAEKNFEKGVTVEVDGGVGPTGILVGIHETGPHFQFLVKRARFHSQLLQDLQLGFFPQLRFRKFDGGCQFLDIGQFHKNHAPTKMDLSII